MNPLNKESAKDVKLKVEDTKLVNMKLKCLRLMDRIIESMYSSRAIILLGKQGFSTDKSDIEEAKKTTKLRLIKRHLRGKTTKALLGEYSQLKIQYETLKKQEML